MGASVRWQDEWSSLTDALRVHTVITRKYHKEANESEREKKAIMMDFWSIIGQNQAQINLFAKTFPLTAHCFNTNMNL
ncbi:hypothetical protein BSNK01_28570 [Bacillaceae bacterium]